MNDDDIIETVSNTIYRPGRSINGRVYPSDLIFRTEGNIPEELFRIRSDGSCSWGTRPEISREFAMEPRPDTIYYINYSYTKKSKEIIIDWGDE